MDCAVLGTLYIRSNGDIPCHDDMGEQIVLGRVGSDDRRWSITQTLSNPLYQHLRRSFDAGQMPWPDVCERCAFLRTNQRPSRGIAERQIRCIQVEASLGCTLACPGCSQGRQIRERPKPFQLPLEVWRGALRSLKAEEYSVGEIEYCGQGEPLTHPKFRDISLLSREYFPATPQRLVTSGNADYGRTCGGAPIERFWVSCDGVHQESYQQYRVNGRVERALKFMRDVPELVDGVRQKVTWKYILFRHNDSEQELLEAQRRAEDMGIDKLMFVLTHSEERSERFSYQNIGELPIDSPLAVVDGTPHLRRDCLTLTSEDAAPSPAVSASRRAGVMVDDLWWDGAERLTVEGWAFADAGVDRLVFTLDGEGVGGTRPLLARPDVEEHFPGLRSPARGFSYSFKAEAGLLPRHTIGVLLMSGGEIVFSSSRAFRTEGTPGVRWR